ncbi:MAG TPA: Hpt domain-containing protein [Caulobacteraceae bacterium]|nr:Hpt domain-containing protein [Caulobacteraceae bacterium]
MARRDITGAVDFAVLEAFTAGDSGVIEEVLNLFREQASLWSPMLDPASEGWRDAAHTVKGAASGIGAHDLARVCGEAEVAPDTLAAPVLERVRDQLEFALADIAAYQHEQALRSLRG